MKNICPEIIIKQLKNTVKSGLKADEGSAN